MTKETTLRRQPLRAQRSSSFPQTCNLNRSTPQEKKNSYLWSARNKGNDVLPEITDSSKEKHTRIQCIAERSERLSCRSSGHKRTKYASKFRHLQIRKEPLLCKLANTSKSPICAFGRHVRRTC